MNTRIEYADFVHGENVRAMALALSLDKWAARRRTELVAESIDLQTELVREEDSRRRDLVAARIAENKKRQAELRDGMSRCHGLNSLLSSEDKQKDTKTFFLQESEERLMTTAGPGPTMRVYSPTSKSETPVRRLNGMASTYNSWTKIADYCYERIADGAFADVIRDCDCVCAYNHNNSEIMARTPESLRLYNIPNQGLNFHADLLPNDALSDGIFARVQRGDLRGCSFAFRVAEDGEFWELPATRHELPYRTITRIGELFDVGPVTRPAYRETSVIAETLSLSEPIGRPGRFERLRELQDKALEDYYTEDDEFDDEDAPLISDAEQKRLRGKYRDILRRRLGW